MEIHNVLDARNNLSRLVARAEAGEEIVIARRGTPVAKIVRYEEPESPYWTGKQIVEWLEANPIPPHLQKTPEEIDAWIAELRGDDE
ncbi:type II toxin-antitoxin system prevent-host-death family antitoxin [Herbiconiux sp.]|jgi:prevent-host-death family protein|uniref:type II toxin-antitoxin system Phd/YefM family antitoxin n=1 Tax=Herbiconiux sp. TaxID=1871186 RepID=UPI0025BE99BA|nr:type II toxin-antitoxin system prevent-host-death family antitoxin [Herbiconiux sp.]